jgi:hypothetical protein
MGVNWSRKQALKGSKLLNSGEHSQWGVGVWMHHILREVWSAERHTNQKSDILN